MARNELELRKTDTIWSDLDRLHHQISQRAYDLFRDRGSLWGGPLSDWLTAERELVWKPAIEVRHKDGQFEVLAATPGVEAKDLDIQVTPDALLIRAELSHEHTADEGTVQLCEFSRGRLFRSVQFPERVNPDSAKAEYRNGLLRMTIAVAKPASKKVDIKAA